MRSRAFGKALAPQVKGQVPCCCNFVSGMRVESVLHVASRIRIQFFAQRLELLRSNSVIITPRQV